MFPHQSDIQLLYFYPNNSVQFQEHLDLFPIEYSVESSVLKKMLLVFFLLLLLSSQDPYS